MNADTSEVAPFGRRLKEADADVIDSHIFPIFGHAPTFVLALPYLWTPKVFG
jgi:hypothetical protein